jgi:hypothetical protein
MGDKIVVGPIDKGLRTNRTAFNIDRDSFPTLINAYQWRGRVKRKRGTKLLGRLKRYIGTTDGAGNLGVFISPTPIPTGISSFVIGSEVFTDPGTTANPGVQILITNSLGLAVLDRVNGTFIVNGSLPNTAVFYFPSLPVMGLEDVILEVNQFPGTMAFDTKYSYIIQTSNPYGIYDVSFYKNPAVDAINLPAYVPKVAPAPLWWNGEDYQQFWTVNYQGALWATNGVTQTFDPTKLGMQFKLIAAAPSIAITNAGNGTTIPAVANITLAGTPTTLIIGDFVFINEVKGIPGINFQTGYVTAVAGNVITVTFPNAILVGVHTSGGIVQYLTNRQDTAIDTLRWYDGDPTNGSATAPAFIQGKGWVNFMPPLSLDNFSIADLPARQYYLVGARMIVPFKDRLLFIGPVVQASSGASIYLRDTVVCSQNGTPYYTASFFYNPASPADPTLADIIFNPILVPVNQIATAPAYFEDVTGFGFGIPAGIDQMITTCFANRDVLIIGFERLQAKFVYTGDDIQPFAFYIVNSELGSSSTFSGITSDFGVYTKGSRGYVITNQNGTERFDLEIPDQVYEVNLRDNGTERVTAAQDFVNEWLYFTYPTNIENIDIYKFPNQTLQYNYRDNSWAIFNECYTHYGIFRRQTGYTWATVGETEFNAWNEWNTPWNAGLSTLLNPDIIAGNQQGFVIWKDEGTEEANSLVIQNIVGNIITSPNHTLNEGDFITITGALGTVGASVNGKIFSVGPPVTANSFVLNPTITAGTYLGGGLIQRMYRPFIQTMQFPVSWGMGRKTRLGPQQYLLTTTEKAQITLLIFLSQNNSSPYNEGILDPNDSLIYSSVLYTCPESSNLGLTPANTNLQMLTAKQQQQIWHRMNTSLLGDTVQIGFTLSDEQMRTVDDAGSPISQFAEIELHSMILDVSSSMLLS